MERLRVFAGGLFSVDSSVGDAVRAVLSPLGLNTARTGSDAYSLGTSYPIEYLARPVLFSNYPCPVLQHRMDSSSTTQP